ncbi:helix-turn-helix domain-containing protein [Paracoccus alkanivorans]|uniref:Helix-turn-helix domain-containing protein n=1 Tax=Paracoccus alkanivorans TaxID=2116655 RepID=A0A3M0M480_9RHOB|nr:helix-turn-helix domain-containing protein [Paracoccus alkanivorans]RMC32023.1 helix-turn-helix domain-containing protein [Paracoccus alkanivorans]
MGSENVSFALAENRRAWRQTVSQAYFALDVEPRDKERFRGSMHRWRLGNVELSRIHCDGLIYRRHDRHLLNETESSLLIAIPEDETINFVQGDRRSTCKPGGFLVERSDAPYEYWHTERNRQWVLKVPTAHVRARLGRAERLGGLAFDAGSGIASFFVSSLHMTINHLEVIDEAARGAAGTHLVELLCLAIMDDQRVLTSNLSSVRAAHLSRAETFIRDHLKDPDLSPGMVAEGCGISLRYLQRLFHESDQSIQGYIRERRLSRCNEELRSLQSSRTISDIAYDWGFTDQAQFSKYYRARFGRTASETRREAMTAPREH